MEARERQIVVVPAGAVHGFKASSEVPLKQISIHPAPAMTTEWARIADFGAPPVRGC